MESEDPATSGASSQLSVSRRRELSDASARSILMTILGEYVLPRDEPVWTATLVTALAKFGVEEKSARQALARAAAEGWLRSQRHGRRAQWILTGPGKRLLTEGAERIYSFGRDRPQWNRKWLVLLVSVPEQKRELRHRLRTRLSWAGFGSPTAGVWVSPNVGREAEAHSILEDLQLADDTLSFVATYASIGYESAIVQQAWDLASVAAYYEEFLEEFSGLQVTDGDGMFRAQTRLVHEWRRFPLLDPQLPRELLPAGWIGEQAAELFHRKHEEWRHGAQRHWDELAGG